MSLVEGGSKSVLVQNGLQKIHTTFENGVECVEAFDIQTQLLIYRKWKKRAQFGFVRQIWEYDVGSLEIENGVQDRKPDNILSEQEVANSREIINGLYLSSDNPVMTRRDLEEYYVFQFTNMPWPENNYKLSVEEDGKSLILRTENRKYYQRIEIFDLQQANIKMQMPFVAMKHHKNLLLIMYRKPPQIMASEKKARDQRKSSGTKEGDVQCPAQ